MTGKPDQAAVMTTVITGTRGNEPAEAGPLSNKENPLLASMNPERIAQVTLECRSHFNNTPREQKIESAQRASRWLNALLAQGGKSTG